MSESQLLGDSFSGRDKAVQCYLADPRDVDRVKKLIVGINERDVQIKQLVGSGGRSGDGNFYGINGSNNAVPFGVPANPTYPSGCTLGQARRSLGKVVSEGVNPTSLAGYAGTSLQLETARASHVDDAGCQTKRTLKICIAVQCDIVKKGDAEYLRAALAHAEQHISRNENIRLTL